MIRRTRNAGLTALGIALLLAAWSAQLRADDGAAKANLINGAGQSVGVVQFLQQGRSFWSKWRCRDCRAASTVSTYTSTGAAIRTR